MLVLALCLNVGYNSVSKKLAIDIGGAKRLNALSTFVSAIVLSPWAFVIWSAREVRT